MHIVLMPLRAFMVFDEILARDNLAVVRLNALAGIYGF